MRTPLTVLALFFALTAQASATTFPGQRLAPPTIAPVLAKAFTHWQEAGVTPTCRPTVWVADTLYSNDVGEAAGRANPSTCEIWLLAATVENIERPQSIEDGALACTTVLHEMGHVFGLSHGDGGVMGSDHDARELAIDMAPESCIRYGRAAVRRTLRSEGWPATTIRQLIYGEMDILQPGELKVYRKSPRWP